MALTLTEALNNLYTTTWQNMKSEVIDQVFDATPFWYWMKDKGKLKTVQGGRFITEPLQYDKNDNVQWITKGGTVPLNDFEFLTVAKYDWRYLTASIVRFWTDDQQNRGKNQIINFMNAKLENTRNALITEMETKLFAGDGSSNNSISGLQYLVPDDEDGSSNDAGGIDPSVYTWWQNQSIDMTGKSFATYGVSYMRTMLNDTMNNRQQDSPDIIVTGQHPYELYEDTVLDFYRVTSNKLADAGFQNQMFKGIPMVWSPSCASADISSTAGRMYFLNTRFLNFVYDPMAFFDMTKWKEIPNQVEDVAAQILTACAFTVNRRRCQGVIHTIDTE